MEFTIDIYSKILNYLDAKSIFKLIMLSTSIMNQLADFFNKRKFMIDLSYYKITDKGLAYLKGVHNINLSGCSQITDKGLAHLKGVHAINLTKCILITDKGLAHLKGVHIINLTEC